VSALNVHLTHKGQDKFSRVYSTSRDYLRQSETYRIRRIYVVSLFKERNPTRLVGYESSNSNKENAENKAEAAAGAAGIAK
jgi:hypothetical protein